jgi:signal transduction histidine kinase
MRTFYKRRKLAVITIVYWLLLSYLIAALAWWFIELWHQNENMYQIRKAQIRADEPGYASQLATITGERNRNHSQYIGEGITFLLVTLIAAVFVYRAVRRQIRQKVQQNNFLMAITHELKTPIAVAKLNLETLNRHKLEPVHQEKLLHKTLEETNRLNDLCNNILLSSQLEEGSIHQSREHINLSELAGETVRNFSSRFPKRQISQSITPDLYWSGDPLLLRLAFNNLVENAIRYSPADQPIMVSLNQEDGHPHFSVADRGEGIPDPEKERIFERFYRIGTDTKKYTKGTGLGLYLTRKISEDHGAQAYVKDNSPTGSIFVIDFYKKGP